VAVVDIQFKTTEITYLFYEWSVFKSLFVFFQCQFMEGLSCVAFLLQVQVYPR